MKRCISLLFTFLLTISLSNSSIVAQVGIGINPPDASAMLDVTSLTKGFLLPRLDPVNVTTPAQGLLVYNTTTSKLNHYNGGSWEEVTVGSGFLDITTAQTIAGAKTFSNDLTPGGRLILPMAEVSFFNYLSPYTLTFTAVSAGATGNDNMVPLAPPTTAFINDNFGTNPSGTRLTYTGTTTRMYHVTLSFSFTAGKKNDEFVFGVAKNDVLIDGSKVVLLSGTGDPRSSAIHVVVTLATNDYIDFYAGKLNATGTINFISTNFFVLGM